MLELHEQLEQLKRNWQASQRFADGLKEYDRRKVDANLDADAQFLKYKDAIALLNSM